jgi:hypothetical protein
MVYIVLAVLAHSMYVAYVACCNCAVGVDDALLTCVLLLSLLDMVHLMWLLLVAAAHNSVVVVLLPMMTLFIPHFQLLQLPMLNLFSF